MTQHISEAILKAAGSRFVQGDSFRMRHRYKENGNVCTTDDKNPAMVVTRTSNGWLFICHRCHKQGMVTDKRLSPGSTRKRIDALRKISISKEVEKVTLPYDFLPLEDRVSADDPIPNVAYHHVWKYGITYDTLKKFNVGWSQSYERLVVPLYEYAFLGDDPPVRKLVGWVGRDVNYTKESKWAKWMTRATKGARRYFTCPGDSEDGLKSVIIVEDAISAMKVHHATGYTTIALLNKRVGDDLLKKLKDKEVFLWLDGDVKPDVVRQTARMRTLGIKARSVFTYKDPKEYNTLYICDLIRSRREGYEADEAAFATEGD